MFLCYSHFVPKIAVITGEKFTDRHLANENDVRPYLIWSRTSYHRIKSLRPEANWLLYSLFGPLSTCLYSGSQSWSEFLNLKDTESVYYICESDY